jgi:two-component system, NarL family, response regulator FusR
MHQDSQFSDTDIHIVDDHSLFAEAFALLLKNTFENNTFYISNGVEAFEKKLAPGKSYYLFMDFHIPGTNTIAEAERLLKKYEGRIKIIIVSSTNSPMVVYQFVQHYAHGFISKNASPGEIAECLKAVELDKKYVSSDLRNEVLDLCLSQKAFSISSRERDILIQIKEGKTIEESASALNISRHTVVSHRRNLMSKLNVRTSRDLLKIMEEWGYL